MRNLTKGFTILFVTALAVTTATDTEDSKKIKIGPPVTITVTSSPKVAVPIIFSADNYTGPYDPADPKGVGAATRRNMKIQGKKTAEVIRSYVPPGIDTFARKELTHVAFSEGRRFAFSHPKEAAELMGIATKMKNLVKAAEKKVKKADEKLAKSHDKH